MDSLQKRIAGLPSEKRRLFENLLAKHGLQAALIQSAPQDQKARSTHLMNSRDDVCSLGNKEGSELPRHTFSQDFPAAEIKKYYRGVYNAISQQLDRAIFGKHAVFCTLGYIPNDSPQYSQVKLPERLLNKNTIKLVLEVIGDCCLTDRKILDVGCGRGGTISVIAEYFDAKEIIGIDLSSGAIRSCKRNHVYDHVRFLEGDAEALPFRDQSFDVVTNVESSHSYPNIADFYREVSRVLKRRGYLLYTDVLPLHRWHENECLLQGCGFVLEQDRDITTNVLMSCDETARNKLAAYDTSNYREFMNNFLGTPESELYRLMRSGELAYRILRFNKVQTVLGKGFDS